MTEAVSLKVSHGRGVLTVTSVLTRKDRTRLWKVGLRALMAYGFVSAVKFVDLVISDQSGFDASVREFFAVRVNIDATG